MHVTQNLLLFVCITDTFILGKIVYVDVENERTVECTDLAANDNGFVNFAKNIFESGRKKWDCKNFCEREIRCY